MADTKDSIGSHSTSPPGHVKKTHSGDTGHSQSPLPPGSSNDDGLPTQVKNDGPADARAAAPAHGVSGFVENLVRKEIVSRKMVGDALTRKKLQGDADKRRLFDILIED